MTDISHLARPISWQYRSNRIAIGLVLLFASAGFVFEGVDTGWGNTAFLAGLRAGLASGLCWALGRELDPDRPVIAELGGLFGGGVAVWFGSDLGALLGLMFAVRILVRTTGLAPTGFDRALLVIVGVGIATTGWGWATSVGLAIAMVWDTALKDPAPRSQRTWAAVMLAGATLVGLLSEVWSDWEPLWLIRAILITSSVLVGVLLTRSIPNSVADYSTEPLSPDRLYQGRIAVVLVMVVATLFVESDQMLPLLAVGALLILTVISSQITEPALPDQISLERRG